MTQENYVNPPSFSTGDVLSASKLNALLTDLDTLAGWYWGPHYGTDQQQYDSTGTGTTVEGWAGWVVLTGDRLTFTMTNPTVGGVVVKVYFNDVQIGNLAGYGSAGTRTIALDIAANGWQMWTPYRIKFITVRPAGTGELDITNVYLTNSTIPNIAATIPAFADETVSDAADFNAIADGITTLAPLFMQPVAGCRGGEEYTVQGTNTGWTTVQSWAMQHRLNSIRASLFIQGPEQAGTVSARLKYNGVVVNGTEAWTVTRGTTPNNSLRVTDQLYTIPGSPVAGTFYTVEFQIRQSTGWLTGWHVSPRYVYEDSSVPGLADSDAARWAHGDYGAGVDGTPALVGMSNSLTKLNDVRAWTNVVQREPIDTFSFPWWPNYNRRVYHVRRWRWLAWKKHEWEPEPPHTDVPSATINWTYDGRTWQSYTLPELDGDEGGFYDFDTGPIVPGMIFYASGVQYAIQTPYPGYVS